MSHNTEILLGKSSQKEDCQLSSGFPHIAVGGRGFAETFQIRYNLIKLSQGPPKDKPLQLIVSAESCSLSCNFFREKGVENCHRRGLLFALPFDS